MAEEKPFWEQYGMAASDARLGFIKALIYGPPGAGKTCLGATFPEPLCIGLTESHGDMSIKLVNPRAHIVPIKDQYYNGKLVKTAKDVLMGLVYDLGHRESPFKSFVLDSLTDAQRIFLSDMKGGQVGAKVTLPEWGTLIDKVKDLAVKLRDLNMHVGVIALSDEVQDDANRIVFRPSLAGKKLPGAIAQYFNLVAFQHKRRERSSTGRSDYISILDGGETMYTKCHPALNPEETPNVTQWVEKLEQYSKEHGEGGIPAPSRVKDKAAEAPVNSGANEILKDPEVIDLFNKLGAPEAKRLATAQKYANKDELIEVLRKRVADQKGA